MQFVVLCLGLLLTDACVSMTPLLKIREKQDRELLCPVNVGLIQYPPLLTVYAHQSKRGAMAIYLHLVGFFSSCFFVCVF